MFKRINKEYETIYGVSIIKDSFKNLGIALFFALIVSFFIATNKFDTVMLFAIYIISISITFLVATKPLIDWITFVRPLYNDLRKQRNILNKYNFLLNDYRKEDY